MKPPALRVVAHSGFHFLLIALMLLAGDSMKTAAARQFQYRFQNPARPQAVFLLTKARLWSLIRPAR
jgi:hypothetical protein